MVKKGKSIILWISVMALMVLSSVVAFAQTTGTTTGPSIPDPTTFNSTLGDTQTYATNLVTGPGKYAIYAALVILGFFFIWNLVRKVVHSK